VTTPNQGMFLYSSHSISGNVIEIEACYFSGVLTATQTFYDTLNIGFLNAGNHSVELTAHQSGDTAVCTFSDTMTMNSSFTVLENPAHLNPLSKKIGKVYPNPSNGSFNIELPNEIQATNIQIRAISGEIIKKTEFREQIDLNVDSGMYLIEFLEGDSTLGYQRLVIQ
ncbi:MAG: T9SS type A sorting domain-containing protein, partial [Crocinitomicaceae bacterium]